MVKTIEERVSTKYIKQDDGCWVWQNCSHLKTGYHLFHYGKNHTPTAELAHRLMYKLHKGTIPAGLHIDHLCRNRRCVNPDHLEAVTPAENNRRVHRQKTHCRRGHQLTPDNIYSRKDRGENRDCKKCRKLAMESFQKRRIVS